MPVGGVFCRAVARKVGACVGWSREPAYATRRGRRLCETGSERCACYANLTCDSGLISDSGGSSSGSGGSAGAGGAGGAQGNSAGPGGGGSRAVRVIDTAAASSSYTNEVHELTGAVSDP